MRNWESGWSLIVNKMGEQDGTPRKKIGIMGGSFDPVHNGHVHLAADARQQAGLDQVLLIPARMQPFKLDRKPASGDDRMEMRRLALEDEPGIEPCSYELDQDSVSYTYLTLRAKKSQKAFVMGHAEKCTVLLVISTGKTWTLIDNQGVRGYVLTSTLTFYDNKPRQYAAGIITVKGKATTKGSTVHVRSSKSNKARQIAEFPVGTPISVFEQDEKWSEVDAGGLHCYILSEFVTLQEPLISVVEHEAPVNTSEPVLKAEANPPEGLALPAAENPGLAPAEPEMIVPEEITDWNWEEWDREERARLEAKAEEQTEENYTFDPVKDELKDYLVQKEDGNYWFVDGIEHVCLTDKIDFNAYLSDPSYASEREFEYLSSSPDNLKVLYMAILEWGDYPHGPLCVSSIDGTYQVALEDTDCSDYKAQWLADGSLVYVGYERIGPDEGISKWDNCVPVVKRVYPDGTWESFFRGNDFQLRMP